MKLKRIFAMLLAFMIGVTFLLAGCDNKKAIVTPSNIVKTDKYKNGYKFDPPITVTTIKFYGAQVKFQPGEDIDNNIWTKAFEEYCGVKMKSLFTVTDFTKYDLKVTTSIATNSLPDIMPVYTTLFFRIADSKKVMDLKPYYDKYFDPELKTMMEKKLGGITYKTCFRNNILSAIASSPELSPGMQWIRQDWLDKYNLQWPKTINDSIKMMRFFCDKNPGAPSSPQTYAFPLTSGLSEITGFANAFGVYKGIWMEDGNGGLVKSDVSPKWKPILKILQEMYTAGQIDNNFTLSQQPDIDTALTNQQFGFVYGGATSPDGGLYNTIAANPKAVWKQGVITDEAGNPALMQVGTRVTSFYCVNKNSKYPEALMFIANVSGDIADGIGAQFRKYHDFTGSDNAYYDSFFYPLILMRYPELDQSAMISYALSTKDFSKLTGEQIGVIDKMKMWTEKEDAYGWRLWAIANPEGSYKTQKEIIDSNWLYPDRGWGPETKTWIDKGPDLSNMSTQIFVRIIRGDLTVDDGFTEWVTYFNNTGGTACTTEITDWWNNQGGKAAFASINAK